MRKLTALLACLLLISQNPCFAVDAMVWEKFNMNIMIGDPVGMYANPEFPFTHFDQYIKTSFAKHHQNSLSKCKNFSSTNDDAYQCAAVSVKSKVKELKDGKTRSVTLDTTNMDDGILNITIANTSDDLGRDVYIATFTTSANSVSMHDIASRYGYSNTEVITDAKFNKSLRVNVEKLNKSNKMYIPKDLLAETEMLLFNFNGTGSLSTVDKVYWKRNATPSPRVKKKN